MRIFKEGINSPKITKLTLLMTILTIFIMMVWFHSVSEKILHTSAMHAAQVDRINTHKLLFHQIHHHVLHLGDTKEEQLDKLEQLEDLIRQWTQNHFELQYGVGRDELESNENPKVAAMLSNLHPHNDGIADAVREFILVAHVNELRAAAIKRVCTHEAAFITLMDNIKSIYDHDNELKIHFLLKLKSSIFWIIIILILVLVANHFSFKKVIDFTFLPKSVKGFFSDEIVAEYIMKSDTVKQAPNLFTNTSQLQSEEKVNIHTSQLKLLIIKDLQIPIDYVAWFINKCGLNFLVMNGIHAAHSAMLNNHFDIVLMSQASKDSLNTPHYHEAHQVIAQVPIVVIDEADLEEINEQIRNKDLENTDELNQPIGKLYEKIIKHVHREKLSI